MRLGNNDRCRCFIRAVKLFNSLQRPWPISTLCLFGSFWSSPTPIHPFLPASWHPPLYIPRAPTTSSCKSPPIPPVVLRKPSKQPLNAIEHPRFFLPLTRSRCRSRAGPKYSTNLLPPLDLLPSTPFRHVFVGQITSDAKPTSHPP